MFPLIRIAGMSETQLHLIVLLLILLLIPLAMFISHGRDRRNRETWHAVERGRRKRNIAEYRTWQWLYGKPKPKRLTDRHHSAKNKPS